MLTTENTDNPEFNLQLDDEADAYFHSYAGISIARAKEICLENELDFNDEFWEPFLAYEESKVS